MLTLYIDDREREITQYIKGYHEGFQYEYNINKKIYLLNIKIGRITTGDYCLIDDDQLVAVFERKTWKDLSSSIKDGRYKNDVNLLDIRRQTGCRVFYLIQGKAFPNRKQKVSGIDYGNLYAKMDHLMMRYNIMFIHVKDEDDLITRMLEFVKNYYTLEPKINFNEYRQYNVELQNKTKDEKLKYYKTNEDKYLTQLYDKSDDRKEILNQLELKLPDLSAIDFTNIKLPDISDANSLPNLPITNPLPSLPIINSLPSLPITNSLPNLDTSPIKIKSEKYIETKHSDLIKKVHSKSISEMVYQVYIDIPGIGDSLANLLKSKHTLKEILMGYVSKETMSKYEINGRKIRYDSIDKIYNIIDLLRSNDAFKSAHKFQTELSILSSFHGLSKDRAAIILKVYSLTNLMTLVGTENDKQIISSIECKDKKGNIKKLGLKLAEKIINIFNYKD